MSSFAEVKVVLLGETGVGKTSIIASFSHEQFCEEKAQTIGACYSLQKITRGNSDVKLKIWDTAGQERFRSLAPMYYRDAQIAILVYAVNDPESLPTLKYWADRLSDLQRQPGIIVVGNKIDLEDRVVDIYEAEEFANSINAYCMECSAKNGNGINELFAQAADMAIGECETKGINQNNIQLSLSRINDEENSSNNSSCWKGCF
ncbi:Vacuolar protein sorting-associated protein 21 [Tritrichomonas foetus]|uniref:Vacuolar protein sorting-associated protein 21 n=1 Tax=Tritrichomonas foetus TaxID=1144522 RepID=A0A1J4JK71_9EUKA|nr:Vacuolar protein sorting-associated protein 21 [Tritrichomonas foetus]|eukprot:OHS97965.1 Vacuolar protein sorting-associated protein 21 [Tritrichomonas foetus]